jgi:hypothetical protein
MFQDIVSLSFWFVSTRISEFVAGHRMIKFFDDDFFYRRLVPNSPGTRPVAPERESAGWGIDSPDLNDTVMR